MIPTPMSRKSLTFQAALTLRIFNYSQIQEAAPVLSTPASIISLDMLEGGAKILQICLA